MTTKLNNDPVEYAFGCLAMTLVLLFLSCAGISCYSRKTREAKEQDALFKFYNENDGKVKILYYTEGQEGGKHKFQVVYCVTEGFKTKERRIFRVSLDPS